MIIGLDFDGVIANSPNLKSEVAKELYGVQIPADCFKKEMVTSMGLNLEQYRHVQHIVYGTERGLLMEPMKDALVCIARLQRKHETVILTARTDNDLEIARQWAQIKAMDNIGFVGVGYETPKTKLVLDLGLDVYVDDYPKKLIELLGYVRYLFLFSWRYNQDFQETQAIKRVDSWKRIYQETQKIAANY